MLYATRVDGGEGGGLMGLFLAFLAIFGIFVILGILGASAEINSTGDHPKKKVRNLVGGGTQSESDSGGGFDGGAG